MAKRTYKANNPGTEDVSAITKGYYEGIREYKASLGPMRVADILESLNGEKGALARELAGLPPDGKLPARGTPERTHYDSQMKNIGRWLAYESGQRGSQARNPENATSSTQDKLKDMFIKNNPPGDMSISITGWIGYENGDFRHRTVSMGDGTHFPVDAQAFIEAMSQGDTHAAYGAAFAHYAPLVVASADNVDISFSEY